jgi:hypothetical protein
LSKHPSPVSKNPTSLLHKGERQFNLLTSLETSRALQVSLNNPCFTFLSVNDGYFGHYVTDHKYLAIIIPSRAFSTVFATWWAIHSKAIQLYYTPGSAFQYIPNNVLEFRFISPTETAALNPIQPFSEVKADFDKKNLNSFDSFFPPIQGIPDGLISMEVININVRRRSQ